tara:strand:- start:1128 stop:2321 length:1194 start_codon:yes stop_codon:yes gene_type:complete
MTTIYSALNEELIGKVNIEEQEINENLLFNSDLLERCRKHSPRIVKSLVGYGKLYKEELQLVDMRQVHPAGKEIKSRKTNKVLPKGFQVRTDITIDTVNRDAISYDISQKDWSPYAEQIILFLLPEEYRYVNDDGIEVIYGILDGNHRFDAASQQLQERVVAWLVDMPLNKIRKYGNAEANRQKNSSKPRSNQDIADSIKIDIEDTTTQLSKEIKKAEDSKELNVSDIIRKEIEDYKVHPNTVPAILRIIIHESNIVVDRKDYDSIRRGLFISEFCPSYVKIKGKEWDYETPEGVRIILIEASGSNHVIVAHKICRMQKENNDPISVIFSNAKGDKVTPENRDILRRRFMTKVYEVIKDIADGYDGIFVKKNAVIPSFECLPELADELETNELIRII